MVKSVERRIAPRAPMGTKIKWKIVGSSQWHEDSSQNVSSTGMMIRTGESVKPGVAVKLSFNLPNLKFQDPMIVEAEVVRQVERNGRHIGLGLRFLTLKSNNYSVVREFVHRILDLPRDDTIKGLGSQDSSGYSYKMEHLIKEAENRKADAIQRKMAQVESKRRKDLIRLWTVRGGKAGIILFGVLLVAKAVCFFMNLADCVLTIQ